MAESVPLWYLTSLCRRGYRLVRLSATQRNWILRRTERIVFDDSLTLTRESTLDISVSRLHWRDGTPTRLPTQGNRILLPIMSFLRTDHYDVRVSTTSGEELPFLPRSRERRLVAAGLARESMRGTHLTSYADRRLLCTRFEEILEVLELDPPLDTGDDELPRGSPDYMHALSGLREFRRSYLIIATPMIDDVFGNRAGWDLHPGLLRLTETHSEVIPGIRANFFDARTANDALLENKTRMLWSASGLQPIVVPKESGIWKSERWTEDVAIEIPASQIMCQSLHMNIVCPPGVYIDQATLAVVSGPEQEHTGLGKSVLQIADDDVHWDSSHFFFSRGMLPDQVVVSAQAMIVLRPRYHGFMRSGQNLALLTVLIMFVYALTLGWRATGWAGIRVGWLNQTNPDPATALLLGALTAALGVMIRPGEHEMTRFVATRYRKDLTAVMLSALAAATAIAIGVQGRLLFPLLLGPSLLALYYLNRIAVSGRYSRKRGLEKPPPKQPSAPRKTNGPGQ